MLWSCVPSFRRPPAGAACCSVSGCRFFSGWRSDARAGPAEATRSGPEDPPTYKHGWWRSRRGSSRPSALRERAFCCPSAPEETSGKQSSGPITEKTLQTLALNKWKEKSVIMDPHLRYFTMICRGRNVQPTFINTNIMRRFKEEVRLGGN